MKVLSTNALGNNKRTINIGILTNKAKIIKYKYKFINIKCNHYKKSNYQCSGLFTV